MFMDCSQLQGMTGYHQW